MSLRLGDSAMRSARQWFSIAVLPMLVSDCVCARLKGFRLSLFSTRFFLSEAGTPLLLQSIINSEGELQICTFWISQNLRHLRWTAQDADGEVHEVPVSNTVEVLEDESDVPQMRFARGQEHEQHSLTVCGESV